METFYLATLIFLFLIQIKTTVERKENEFSFTKTCKTGCRNYLNLVNTEVKSRIINKVTPKITKITYPEEINALIMYRRYFRIIIKKNWGSRPTLVETKEKQPDKKEAQTWAERGKCQIGKMCKPDGDCWGSSSDTCFDLRTDTWVSGQSFTYKGISWDASFHHTCTFDWECSITEKTFKIHISGSGMPYIGVGEQVFMLNLEDENYFNLQSYIVYYNSKIRFTKEQISPQCFTDNNNLYCEDKSDNGNFYFTIRAGSTCESIANTVYCLNRGKTQDENNPKSIIPASTSDLNQIKDAINVISQIEDFNNYATRKEIFNMKQAIQKMMIELLKTNPNILSPFFTKPVFARHMQGNVVEVCPCKEDMNCKERESHHKNISFCIKKNDDYKNYSIFPASDALVLIDDVAFKFQGVDANPILDIFEKEVLGDSTFLNGDNDEKYDLGDYSFLSVLWESILKYSGLCSLIMIVSYSLLRRV